VDKSERENLKEIKKLEVLSAAARAIVENCLVENRLDWDIIETNDYISLAIPLEKCGIEINLKKEDVHEWKDSLDSFVKDSAEKKTEREIATLAESYGFEWGGKCHLVISDDGWVLQCDSRAVYVHIGAGVRRISEYAFRGNSKLRYVDLGEVRSVGRQAFSYCRNLKSVKWSSNLEFIDISAFAHTALEVVEIGDKVRKISSGAFIWCKELKSLVLGENLKEIGSRTFLGCKSLVRINFRGSAEEWKRIKKGRKWKGNVPCDMIECKNGDMVKEEFEKARSAEGLRAYLEL